MVDFEISRRTLKSYVKILCISPLFQKICKNSDKQKYTGHKKREPKLPFN